MNQASYESFDQMGVSKVITFLLLGFFPLLGIAVFLLGVYVLYVSIEYDGYTVWTALAFFLPEVIVAAGLLILGWLFIADGLAHYRFEENGLWAKYPLQKPILIPWDDFQQVCVVYAAYSTRGGARASTVLCCVKKGEKLNGRRRWKTDNPFHYRSVITIVYTPELHQGLIERCTQEVVDLRDTMAYSLKYW